MKPGDQLNQHFDLQLAANAQALGLLVAGISSVLGGELVFQAIQAARSHAQATDPMLLQGFLVNTMLAAAKDQADTQARVAQRQRGDEGLQ